MFFDEKPIENKFIANIHKFGINQEKLFRKELDFKCLEYTDRQNLEEINRLEDLRNNLNNEQNTGLFQSGNYWWKLPYEDVKNYLLFDLCIDDTPDDNWKYEHRWEIVDNDKYKSIVLIEVGHCSIFDVSEYRNYERLSQYSTEEQEAKVKKFNKSMDRIAMLDIALNGDNPVRSSESGKIYESRTSYYLSSEYMINRWFYNSVYQRSLYTEHISKGVVAKSNSIHYECAYHVCDIITDEDKLIYLKNCGAKFLGGKGDIDENVINKYINRDCEILTAVAVAQCDLIGKIPFHLFKNDMENKADSYDMAMRQAEIFTCIASKLI